jgi:hypothetical protein
MHYHLLNALSFKDLVSFLFKLAYIKLSKYWLNIMNSTMLRNKNKYKLGQEIKNYAI